MLPSSIAIEGKIEVTRNGIVSLSPKGGALDFDGATNEHCGEEMDSVRDPGQISTKRGYLCYDPKNSKDLVLSILTN